MQEVPEDFFVDIISQNNFLVASLSDLFANVREHEDMSPQLRQKAISFENHLTKKFGWDFSQEEDEYAPVVVELWKYNFWMKLSYFTYDTRTAQWGWRLLLFPRQKF